MRANFTLSREDEKHVALRVLKIIGMVILGIGIAILLGFVLMWLWNWLMPGIFGLGTITYWKAVGLFILAKIIFGGFSGSGDSDKSKKHPSPIKDEIKSEIEKEIDKEFDNKYAEDIEVELKDNEDFDKAYEEWWVAQGEQSFKAFVKGEK